MWQNKHKMKINTQNIIKRLTISVFISFRQGLGLRILIFILPIISFAQEKEKDSHLPEGNDLFAAKDYVEAEAEYRISQSKFKKKSIASYNLGTAIYRQNFSGEAKLQFAKAVNEAKSKLEKKQAFYNLGNSLMNEKDYTNAVEAYKNALRNDPKDDETRYNYALAKKMLKENPPKKDDDKNKDKDKDKKEDKKDKPDPKKDEDKKDNKDKNKDKKPDGKDKEDKGDGEKPQPQPNGANKQRIQNLLDAVNNEEKKVQDKVNAQKVKAQTSKNEKDW